MNVRSFSAALGNVRDEYVAEAAAYEQKRKSRHWVKWGALAACLCLAAGGVGIFCYKLEHPYPVKNIVTHTVEEIYRIPRWEDLKIYEQYYEIPMEGGNYTARRGEIPSERVGVELGSVTARGWDEYVSYAGEEGGIRYLGATVYEIMGISTECAVAVRYDGTDVFYSAVNVFYRPETMEQFVTDLDLHNTLVFNFVQYEYRKPISGEYVTVHFKNVDDTKIWAMLLANPAAVNEYDETVFYEMGGLLDISVDVPLLGYENICISVKENGYIMTNILDTGKLFYVGEESAQALVDYLLKEGEGYEIVWIDEGSVYPEYSPVVPVPCEE